jgi:hypothetical protein
MIKKNEANAELARRMGWKLVLHGYGVSPDEFVVPQPRKVPDYFTDHAAARELVIWFGRQMAQAQTFVLTEDFWFALVESVWGEHPPSASDRLAFEFSLIAATSEQIARAACAALGIEVEDKNGSPTS